MMRVALQGNINEANNSSNGSLKLKESLALNIPVAKKEVLQAALKRMMEFQNTN